MGLGRDGSKLVTGSLDKTVRVWNVADGKTLLTIPSLPAGVGAVAVSANNVLVAAGLMDGIVKVFDMTARDPAKAERASYRSSDGASATALAFLPDSRTIISGSGDKVVELWTLPSSAATKTLAGHTGQIYRVAWSPDGKLAATAAADKTARIWDIAKATQVRSINAHANVVYALAFSPKGDVLATGGDDKLIKYWNVADGKELRKSQGHGASDLRPGLPPRRDQARLRLGRQDDPHLERRGRQGAAQARWASV